MEKYVIPKFSLPSGAVVKETTAFCEKNHCVLFEKETGHILCMDKKCFDNFAAQNVSDGIARKLSSHCFVSSNETKCQMEQCEIFPEFFMIDLTNKCNMQCKYCLRDVNHKAQSVSTQVISDICNYINKYIEEFHPKNISIQPWGGEPLLELDKILNMRQNIVSLNTKIHFSIETNGLLLTDEVLKKLYDAKIGIGISIDGYERLHDQQRILPNGSGTHKTVEKHLRKSLELFGQRVGTITTITRQNADYIESILDYFVKEIGLKHVKFNFVHPSVFFDCNDICVDEKLISVTILRLLNRMVDLIEIGYQVEEHNICVKLKNILTNKFTDICHSRGCNGGKRMIVFDRNGNIFPCEMTDTPKEKLGSIYEPISLLDMIHKSVGIRDYFLVKKEEICESCEWYIYCRGGCTVRTICSGKRPPLIDRIECAVNRTLYPALMELILTKPNVVNKLLECDLLET